MQYTINAWNVHTEEWKQYGPFTEAPQITYDLLRNTDDGGTELAVYDPEGETLFSKVEGKNMNIDGWKFVADGFLATDFVIGAKA